MADTKLILEIDDFPKKGLYTEFDVESYHLGNFNHGGSSAAWDLKMARSGSLYITKKPDKHSALWEIMAYRNQDVRDRTVSFPQMALSIQKQNLRVIYDFFDVTIDGHKRNLGAAMSELVSFQYEKSRMFTIEVESVSAP